MRCVGRTRQRQPAVARFSWLAALATAGNCPTLARLCATTREAVRDRVGGYNCDARDADWTERSDTRAISPVPPLALLFSCCSSLTMNPDAVITLEHTSEGGVGVAKTIRRAGSGVKPMMGDKVRVQYIGMLDDGSVFTESRNVANPGGVLTLTLGMRMLWGTGVRCIAATALLPPRCCHTAPPLDCH